MSKTHNTHEAMLYERQANDIVRCYLCGHRCTIRPGQTGACRVRRNTGGRLETLNYESVVAVNIDPIEKKPLYHFLPGSRSLSVAAAGCNFQCAFCQNWQISQLPQTGKVDTGVTVEPARLVEEAVSHGCASISYTYTEPTVFFELAYDTAGLAKAAGLGNCFVSNGFMTPEAVRAIAPVLDAINVDLKAFRDETYRRVMKGRLEPVLECLRTLVAEGVWVEVTTLVVPGLNDSEAELGDIARFIAGELGPDVPWHISRFHGDFQMADTPATPIATLQRAREIGQDAGLRYLYIGNAYLPGAGDTRCPQCDSVVLKREGLGLAENHLADGTCPTCATAIAGRWSL